jgi:acyl carrier protein
MNRQAISDKLKELISPFVSDKERLKNAPEEALLREELNISSMHMVDVVIDVEAAFDIEIPADDVDHLNRIGDVIDLIERLLSMRPGSQ